MYNSDSEDEDDDDMDTENGRATDPFRAYPNNQRSAQSYYVETPAIQARRARIAAQAQAGVGRRTSFAVSSQSSSPASRYLSTSPTASSPAMEDYHQEVEHSASSSPSSSDRWSLKRRWSRKLGDVNPWDAKPNTLKKSQPEQPPFVFQEDEEEAVSVHEKEDYT